MPTSWMDRQRSPHPPSQQLEASVVLMNLDSAAVQQHAAPQSEHMNIDLELLVAHRKETHSAAVITGHVTGEVVKQQYAMESRQQAQWL